MKMNDEHKRIIHLVVQGLTNVEIAEEMGYCTATVKKRLKEIYNRFGIKGRIGLVKGVLCAKIVP